MITGEIKNKVDQIWNTFWSGGVSNPLSVIEQITYLLFAKRLDELHTAKEAQANLLGEDITAPIFEEGHDHLRWSRFKDFEPERKFNVFKDEVFPFIKSLNGRAGSSYTKFMKNAVFIMPNPALLDRVVNMIDDIPMKDRDTKGDLYEYMLSKIATAGQNGQFRTPRHIIKMMVELTAPTPKGIICDPACGTCGFLVAAAEYLEDHQKEILRDEDLKEHFHHHMFHGSDFDSSMLRIGAMNMTLHGIDNPLIEDRDSLSEDHADQRDAYTFITSAKEQKTHNEWSFDGEAICIPIVSATGHGHASIKHIHYTDGKFEAATIVAVLMRKEGIKIHVPYVYYYLLAHKDALLVPLMRGSANVSLNLTRLGKLRIPIPSMDDQIFLAKDLVHKKINIEIAKANLARANDEFSIELKKVQKLL